MNENLLLSLLFFFLFLVIVINIFLFFKRNKEKKNFNMSSRLGDNVVKAMADKIQFESRQHRRNREN